MAKLTLIKCDTKRRRALLILAEKWARRDINRVWSAVARSALSADDKQAMFNEIWG